jgi:hypothetical protein
VACDALADNGLENVLHLSNPNAADLNALGEARIPGYRRAYKRSMIMEEAFGLSAFAMLSADSGDLIGTLEMMQSGSARSAALGRLLSPLAAAWRVFALPGELAAYRSRLQEVQQLSLQPYHQTAQQWKDMESRLETKPGGIMVSLLLPALSRCAASTAGVEARRHLANLAVAAERYRLKEGSYPQSAQALVPTYIPALPVDPFDGKPIRVLQTEGGLVLYSIGPDLKDDGGAALDRAKNTGDITFCLGKAFEARKLTP